MSQYRNIDDFFEGNDLSEKPNLTRENINIVLNCKRSTCYKVSMGILFFLLIPQIICFIFVRVKELGYISLGLIFIILLLSFLTKKCLEITFNYAKEIVNIRLINRLNIPIKIINISFKNIHFKFEEKDYFSHTGNLYISNRYKELEELASLNESNITKKPAKIYYTFENIESKESSYSLETELNGFAYQRIPRCPMYCDMEYEMTGKFSKNSYREFGPYYKMNDYFYCYIIKNPNNVKYFHYFMVYLVFSFIACNICLIYNIYPILSIIFYVLTNIINIIVYLVKRERVYRIDIIYSALERKIFIGLVKKGERSYLKTFIYDIEKIKKFILSQFENQKNKFSLKLINNQNEEKFIYNLYGTKKELEGLAYILNKY